MSLPVSKRVGRYLLVLLLGISFVKGAVVNMVPYTTKPPDRNCVPLPKPLGKSILQCWKTANSVKKNLLLKMGVPSCSTCVNIEPNLMFRDSGRRMGKLINRLRCLYTLQDAALKKDSLSSDLLFISSADLDAMLRYVDEILSKPEVCIWLRLHPFIKCKDYMSDDVDSQKIRDKDRVYRLGYEYTAELQNYLEKLYLASST